MKNITLQFCLTGLILVSGITTISAFTSSLHHASISRGQTIHYTPSFHPNHRARNNQSGEKNGIRKNSSRQKVTARYGFKSAVFGNIELKDLFYDETSLAFDAWEWTANMGAPAALIGGAVLVTLSETREALSPRKNDLRWIRLAKLSMRYLLLSSFALEVVSIFVGTMTGSVLLGHGPQSAAKAVGYKSPLQLLHYHHELEFLTTQICFLQGLFNWLGAVALEMIIPKPSETKSARRMNRCLAGWLMSFVVWMLAFYNNHLSFYSDYSTMLRRFGVLFVRDYFLAKPFRPLSLLYGPAFALSAFLTGRAFTSPPEEDEDDEEVDLNPAANQS